MDTVLWCLDDPGSLPYDNCYTMAGGSRGRHFPYRGGFALGPGQTTDTSYVKLPEVGGIIGFDQVHGPEGMVYGTVPYQKRDFLRVYLEWREDARGGERRAVRHFNWMIHPYQLTPAVLGTDGRSPRTHIAELVQWLGDNFIERADESGLVVARFASAAALRAAYEAWAAAYPAEAAALQATLAAGQRPFHLPAILDRMETAYYAGALTGAGSDLVVHQLTDRTTSAPLFVAWSRGGTVPLEPVLTGTFRVLHGDGATAELPSGDVQVGAEPVVLEYVSLVAVASGTDAGGSGVRLGPVRPSPVRATARVAFTLPQAAVVSLRLHDVAGRLAATLASGPFPAGRHEVVMDAARLPAGVYLCRLGAGGMEAESRVVVVK